MSSAIFIRVLICIALLGVFLYGYISKQNTITELRLQIPIAAKELEAALQENTRLQFEIDRFENPQHLMELSSQPQFSHLKHPLLDEILVIEVP
jgi:hypothetical protein